MSCSSYSILPLPSLANPPDAFYFVPVFSSVRGASPAAAGSGCDSTPGLRCNSKCHGAEEMDTCRTSTSERDASLLTPLLAMPVQDRPEHDLSVNKTLHGMAWHGIGFMCRNFGSLACLLPFIGADTCQRRIHAAVQQLGYQDCNMMNADYFG